MTSFTATSEVARWEFRRYFKIRQQLISAAITAVAVAVAIGLGRRDSPRSPVDIVVIGPGATELAAQPETGRFRIAAHDAAEVSTLRDAVGAEELDGLLVLNDAGVTSAELIVRESAGWIDDLQLVLSEHATHARLRQEGIAPDVLMRVLAPAQLDVAYHEAGRAPFSRGERVIFIVAMSFVIMALFTGVSYLFASITGEKQIRVTEQVISAIPAQSWIDGKILGLAALSLVSVLNTALAIAAVMLIMGGGPSGASLPPIAGDPVAIALILVFSVLGFFFWFAFMAAIAAMIDDPHTSTRSTLLFLPIAAGAVAFMALGDPDGQLVRVLSLVPPTSATVLPARLLLTSVPALEIAASLALLLGAVLLLRLAAGRVFRIAMLMYGKEPTWSEARRWAFGVARD